MPRGARRWALLLGVAACLGGGSSLLAGCQGSALAAGKLYLKQNKDAEAVEQLELAARLEPDNAETQYHLGRAYGRAGSWTRMVAAFDRSLTLSPNYQGKIIEARRRHWARVYNAGVAAAAGREPDLTTARRHFRTATVIRPGELRAWRNLAAVEYRLGDVTAALESYEHIVEAAPGDSTSHRILGAIHLNERRYEAAARHFESVLEVGPHQGAWVNLGITRLQLDQLQAAHESFEAALELSADCFECHYNLGNLHWAQGDYAAARQAYEQAVALSPGDVDARFNLAVTYLALEENGLALPLLETLSAEVPDNAVVWRELSRLYRLESRVAEGEAARARAEALGR